MPAFDPELTFQQRMTLKGQAEALKRRADTLGTRLKDFIKGNYSYENDNGSRFFEFENTIEIDGKVYKGMEARRRVSTPMDLDKAEEILKERGLYEDCLTPVLDEEKIYLLVQKGKLSARDIDEMLQENESWSLYPTEGEVF